MFNLKDLIKNFLKKGITISYSTGEPFHPEFQERTSAMQDLLNPRQVKKKKKKTIFDFPEDNEL